MKISQKLISGFTSIALSIVIVGGVAVYYQNEIIKNNALREISRIGYRFSGLEERDTKILSAALEVFTHNQSFKDVYLEKDREKLYNYGQPMFQELKNRYGITHFYFILPDGHCFVRLHDKDIYGDLITRYTFCKARDTKKIAYGMELGKTAFALRVVMPYYNNNELIGYVEFGEEIEHFLKSLKGETGNEFAIFADKNYLDKEEWRLVRQTAGLRDNWNDLEQHIIIASTAGEKTKTTGFFVEADIERIEKREAFLRQIQNRDKTFAYGGFEIRDAGNRHVGSVLSFIDITNSIAIAQKARDIILAILVILLIICLSISFIISRSILNPIIKLMQATIKIGKGELDTRIKIESKDELGYLAGSFNKMAEDLKMTTTSIDKLNKEIAERKQTEKQLRASEDELKRSYVKLKEMQDQLIQAEKLNAIGQLASGVAHEVRNPLGIILQGVNYLEKKIAAKEGDIFEILIMLKDSVKRADKIINALLDFSKAASLNLEPEDVSSILETSLSLVKARFNLGNINIIMETKKDMPKVIVDKNKLEQVFINLLLNASQAMPDGGKIIIRSYDKKLGEIANGIGRREDDCFQVGESAVIVEIEDTGSGVSEENLKKIFDPFFTTKSSTGGTGLGLSVTRNIISMHKGLIDIKSQIGKGTTVTIILKIAKR